MKKPIFAAIALLVAAAALPADQYGAFSGAVDFHASVAKLAERPEAIDPARLYLVEGLITSVRIVSEGPQGFLAEAELLGAAWDGDEDIRSWRIALLFAKPAFAELVKAKTSQVANDDEFGPGSRGFALLQLASLLPGNGPSAGKTPVFVVHDFRVLH